jgi:hypothetical protein
VPWSTILSGVVGTDVPSLHAFLVILSRNDPEYDSDDINYNNPPCMCYHIKGEVQPEEALELTPPDQSPHSHTANLQEKADRLRTQQVDLEAVEAKLEHQRQDISW